jgi:restriction endonuclease S subunit
MDANCHDCLEAPPEGVGIPEEWKVVRLRDIVKIV